MRWSNTTACGADSKTKRPINPKLYRRNLVLEDIDLWASRLLAIRFSDAAW
jgi:hypothetical protein